MSHVVEGREQGSASGAIGEQENKCFIIVIKHILFLYLISYMTLCEGLYFS